MQDVLSADVRLLEIENIANGLFPCQQEAKEKRSYQ